MTAEEDKSQQIFQVDKKSSSSSSGLSRYIQERLQQGSLESQPEQAVAASETKAEFLWQAEAAYDPEQQNNPSESCGLILHHMDSQLVHDHLDRYLPSATTRLYVMRDRLLNERKMLLEELNRYKRFQGKEYYSKINALQTRVALLEAKVDQIDERLKQINPFQGMYHFFQKFFAKPQAEFQQPDANPWKFIPNPKQVTHQVADLNHELQSLQTLLEDHLHDPGFTPQQLGRLVNQYDYNLKQAERMIEELKQRKTLADHLQAKMISLYHRFKS
jgi:predicted  nucleic acid-binding Zn-ribbon protein